MITRGKLFAGLIALTLVAGACSNSSDSPASTGATSTTKGTADAPSRSDFNQPIAEGTPAKGGAITVGVEASVASLDPAGALIQVSDIDTALALYDPLVGFDAKGSYAPGLATKWSNSADLKTWTLTVRTGVTFGDGTPFDADAVVKHFARLKDPVTKCTCATQVALISSVKAPNATTVVFTLTQPNAFFIDTLAKPIGYIASPTATAKWGADYGRHPVGTGPFTLQSYDPLILTRNPTYWRKDAKGGTLPHLDQITIKAIPDNAIRFQSLESGGIDLMQVADTATIISAIQAKKYDVQKITGSSSLSLSFNNRKAPFSDVRLRQAVAMAVNRDELNSILYKSSRELAYSQFATTSPYYDADAGWLKYDPVKAKQLVAAAKAAGEKTTFSLMCVTSDEGRSLLNLVKRQLATVGLTANLEFVDQGAYVNKLLGADHDFTMGCSRNGENTTPDLYEGWFSTGSNNAEGFDDPIADDLMVKIRATADQKELVALAGKLQVQLAKNVPAFPLLYDLFANVANRKVSGLSRPEPNQLGAIRFADLYLKQ